MVKKYLLVDPEYSPPNLANTSEELDTLARNKVIGVFDDYRKARKYTAGDKEVDLKEKWDESYRLYMSIRDNNSHNYQGQAKIFVPVSRRAVNIIESEASNALFGRDDYFSVDGFNPQVAEYNMREHAFNVVKHYSDTEDYVSEFELALKQNLIYGNTATRVGFKVTITENVQRKIVEIPKIDEFTGEEVLDEQGNPVMTYRTELHRVVNELKRPYIEAIDIYRLYVNPLATNPEDYDIVYKNEMNRDMLLSMVENGQYNEDAVLKLLSEEPKIQHDEDDESNGEGKASLINFEPEDKENGNYEVLQFEGLFMQVEEDGTSKRAVQFFIDIGNRQHVLRCQQNPLIGQYKTFSTCNYDAMMAEFYTDGVIDPIKGIQYEINDKENQSIDAVSFDLNAPFEVLRSSGLTDVDMLQVYKVPHKALFVREANSIRKVTMQINTNHLSAEINRLIGYVDNVTGSTSLAAGSPTGTQADRSGKALGLLQNQTRSQFSRLIRKYERNIIQNTLQKVWKMTMQYSDEEIAMKVSEDESGKKINTMLSPSDIIGEYSIKVSGGSEYLKEREMRDSMLEFMSVAGMNDVFMQSVDKVPLLKTIAKSSAYDLSEFVNPDNMYENQRKQIEQLTQNLEQSTEQIKQYGEDIKMLQGQVKEAQKAAKNGQATETAIK